MWLFFNLDEKNTLTILDFLRIGIKEIFSYPFGFLRMALSTARQSAIAAELRSALLTMANRI